MTPLVKEANELATTKPPIEKLLPFVQHEINQKRRSWTLTTMSFEDASQEVMIRVWKQYEKGLFDPTKAPFQHWLNRLITNAFKNLLRDNLLRWQRPCIRDGGCVYNLGDGHCSFTKSGNQCEECPLFKEWKQKKESEYNIKASVALEHHSQEVHSIQSDFADIEGAKKIIDAKMLAELGRWERIVYRLLYIDNLTPIQASEQLKIIAARPRKRPLKPTDAVEYQMVLRLATEMRQMMKLIIIRENLA